MSARLSLDDRVLVRAPSWLGDFIAVEPIVRALFESRARAGREARLAVAAPERFLDLFHGRFAGMERIALRSRTSARFHGQPPPGEHAGHYRGRDFAILLNGSWRSAWTAWRARVPHRAGFASGGRGVLLSHVWRPARERGATPVGLGTRGAYPRFLPRPFGAACVELVHSLGLEVRERKPTLVVSDGSRAVASSRLAEAGIAIDEPFVLANAGARPSSAKGFPPDRFAAALAEIARRTAWPIVFACAGGEEASARAAHDACTAKHKTLLVDPPVGLPELAAVSAAAALVVTPDNGSRHVAEAFDAPTVVLCGPTDPRHTAEHGPFTRIVRVTVPCGPCHRETCPLHGDAHHACMRKIDLDEIVAAAIECRPTLRRPPRTAAGG